MGSEIMRGQSTASLLLGFYILMNLMVQDVCAALGIASSCIIVFFHNVLYHLKLEFGFGLAAGRRKRL